MNTLNHFRFVGVLTCCLLIGSFSSARAQEAAQAKLPATPSAAVLANWNDIGNRLITMAKDWPEDQYGYKLTPEVRSFSAVMLHIAGSNYDLLNGITKTKVGDGRNDPPVAEYTTKAEVVAFLTKSVTDGAAEIEKEGDAGTLKNLYLWIGYTEHMGEHYGLLVAYYRANKMIPPESRPKK
jgi:hypothetical protein